MPEDCGYLEERYKNKLRNMQNNVGTYLKPTRVCAYCGTDPEKSACVNCGAPQHDFSKYRKLDTRTKVRELLIAEYNLMHNQN